MALGDDLHAAVQKIFKETWNTREGQKVPNAEDIQLGNHAVKLDATVLYADLADSTDLVDSYDPRFAAQIYKTFLHSAAKIIRSESGVITAYDGDRVMAVFIGGAKNTSAARCALKINWAAKKIIQPALEHQFPKSPYKVGHTVGIDTSELHVARTGIRGSNDLVWVGSAANYAAKLSAVDGDPSWITSGVYDMLHEDAKLGGDPRQSMWIKRWWVERGMYVYSSSWWWQL